MLFVNSDKNAFLSRLLLVVISNADLGDFTYPSYNDLYVVCFIFEIDGKSSS